MKCVDVGSFSWAVSKIVLVLNFYFAICDTRWSRCNFPSIFGFLRQEKWIVVLFYWVKRVQRQNTCKPSKRVSTCKDYVIGREITTVREQRNSWNMWLLWLLCYAFTHGKTIKFLIVSFVWEWKLLLIALLSVVSSGMGCYFGIVHVHTYPEESSRLKPLRHLWLHHQSRVMVQ